MLKRKHNNVATSNVNLIDVKDFLPIGSIVILSDGKKYLIHKLVVDDQCSKNRYYDYSAVSYPDAIFDHTEICFNHVDIKEIIHRGYEDEEYKENIEMFSSFQHM